MTAKEIIKQLANINEASEKVRRDTYNAVKDLLGCISDIDEDEDYKSLIEALTKVNEDCEKLVESRRTIDEAQNTEYERK